MQDAHVGFLLHRRGQIGHQTLLVGIGDRQRQQPVAVALGRHGIDQTADGCRVVADEHPGGVRSGRGTGPALLPPDLVTGVCDRLRIALSIVLCGKLAQGIEGCLIGIGAVEQRGQLGDAAVFEQSNGFGARRVIGPTRPPLVGLLVLEPVLAVLERIGGQIELECRPVYHGIEIGNVSGDVGLSQCVDDLTMIGAVLTHRGDRPRCVGRIRPGAHGGGRQHRLRADLEQHRASQFGQCRHALGEFDRLPGVPTPVGAVELGGSAERGPRAVAHQNTLGRLVFELIGKRLESIQRRVQQRGVEGVAGVQPVATYSGVGQSGDGLLQIRCRTGQHGVRAVVGGHRQARILVHESLDPIGIGEDGRHPAAGGQLTEESAAFGEQSDAVLHAEDTGDAGRRILADTVAEHDIGLQAPGFPQPGQAHLDREDRGLGVLRQSDGRVTLGGVEDQIEQRDVECIRAAGHGVGEDRLGLEELSCHSGVLAALAREQPGGLGCVDTVTAHQTRCGAVVGQRAEQVARRLRRVDHQCGPVLEVGPAGTGGQADVGQGGLGMLAEPGAVLLGGLHQCGGCARRQGQHHEPPVIAGGDLGRHGFGRFLEDDVGVGAGEPERADAGQTRPVRALPGGRLLDDADRDAIPWDVRGRVLEVQVLG